MTKASDNPFPSVLLVEGTEPSAPSSGQQRLYVDSTSHHLTRTDSSGNEVDLESGQTKEFNTQTGTSYTLVLADRYKLVTLSNASAITLTVPPNSSVAFPVGTVIDMAQLGAGQVTITPGAAVTVNATPGLKIAAQYGVASIVKTATDTWLAYGRLSA